MPDEGHEGPLSTEDLLRRAQQVAEDLHALAQQELVEATRHRKSVETEAHALHEAAAADRERATRALFRAEAQVEEAAREARQLVADAAEQSALLMRVAEEQRVQILDQAEAAARQQQEEAARALTNARAEAERLLEDAGRQSETYLSDARAAADQQISSNQARLDELRRQAEESASQLRTETADEITALRSDAAAEVEALRTEAVRHAAALRAEAEQVLSQARTEADRVIRHTRERADDELRSAAEQTAWTHATMESLLATAELEARRIRSRGHADAAAHLQSRRRHVQQVLSRLTARLREVIADADDKAVELGELGRSVLAAARKQAEQILSAAEEEAEQIRTELQEDKAIVEQRVQRRLQEAETGARALREYVAEEVTRHRRAAQDYEHEARRQATTTMEEARAEADSVRSLARSQLEHARREVAALNARRDEIATELEQLSGVINALAVPEGTVLPHPPTGGEAPAPGEPTLSSSAESHPAEEDENR